MTKEELNSIEINDFLYCTDEKGLNNFHYGHYYPVTKTIYDKKDIETKLVSAAVINDTGKEIYIDANIIESNFLPSTVKKSKLNSLKSDRVEHPSHYTWLKDKCGIEVIDITRHLNFNIGNIIKYCLRAGHKSEEGLSDKDKTIEDLKKAKFYIEDEIKRIENA